MLRKIFKHLRSRNGSSLLMAMAFFLICFFVGSAIFAAGSANLGRLTHMRENRQALLSQRSAALLLKEQLTLPGGNLKVHTEKTKRITVKGGEESSVDTSKIQAPKIEIPDKERTSELYTVMCQAAAWRHFQKMQDSKTDGFTLEDPVLYDGTGLLPKTQPNGKLLVTLEDGDTQEAEYSCEFTATGGTLVFRIDFDQVCVMVRGTVSGEELEEIPRETKEMVSETSSVTIREEKICQTISWSKPIITKGGARK